MDAINYDDLRVLYRGSVCLYKGTPVKVTEIKEEGRNNIFTLYNLELKKSFNVAFKIEDFSPIEGRIGFVNHSNMSFYITRRPSRQWIIGLAPTNIRINVLAKPAHYDCKHKAFAEIQELDTRAVLSAIKGEYPSFEEATHKAITTGGVFAFDRQFAIDCDKSVYFKTTKVGSLKRGENIQSIILDSKYEYLELPLMQHYEKTFRTFNN
jgi:hypothetical protein